MAEEKTPAKKPAPTLSKGSSSLGKKTSGAVVAVRWARGLSLFGAFLTALLGLSSAFGAVTDIFVLRAIVALVLLVGLPLFASDKILSRMKSPNDKLAVVLDVFGLFWMTLAWLFVAALPKVFVAEGDRQTRAGSTTLAKTVYFLGGVSPTFRTERSLVPAPSASAPGAGASAPGVGASAPAVAPSAPQGDH